MPELDAQTFAHTAKGRLIALDLGEKRVGVALSDPGQRLATPWTVWDRRPFGKVAEKLHTFYDQEQATGLIIGLPLNADGTAGQRVQATKAFARNYLKTHDCPVLYWDERYSSMAAEEALSLAGLTAEQQKHKTDKIAAALILQSYLGRVVS